MFTKYSFLASYNRILYKHPFVTNMITAGLLAGAGDMICQTFFEDRSKGLNLSRTGRMVSIAVLLTPPTRLWYNFVPKLAEKFVSREFLRPFAITILNQVIFAPPLMTSWLFLAKYLETGDVGQSIESMKNRWWQAIKASWTVWPFANLIAFSVIPDAHRILFMNLVSFIWNIFISWLHHSPVASKEIEKS